jgi:hypothetical protein
MIPKVSDSFAQPPLHPGRFPQLIGGFAAKALILQRKNTIMAEKD